jgi:glyoxylase-like metal-dependent hydrolase (beta-lactamase superfamily II)
MHSSLARIGNARVARIQLGGIMFRMTTVGAVCAVLLTVGCSGGDASPAAGPIDASETLREVAVAMGAENLDSITFSGTAKAARNSFLQTPSANPPWPFNDITNYQRTIDLTRPASRATGETFNGGLFMGPPVAGTYTQNITPDQTAWTQQLEIWLTPWGFLRGAQMNGAEAMSQNGEGGRYRVVTWKSPATQTSPSGLQYTVNGYINDSNLIERVETWVEHPMLGDMHVQALYSDYRELGGLMVPARMVQERGGGSIFEVTVTDATANPPNVAELVTPPPPPAGRGGGPGRAGGPGGAPGAGAAPTELAQKVADGVYLITGGYVALVAEFSDHVAVFEGGQSEERGQQIIDEVKRVIPGKPIRYVINSHPHSDHSSGLAPFLREGATLITQRNNVEFFDRAFKTPRTLLGQPTMNPQIEGVDELRVLEDDTMRLELHSVPNAHSDGTLVGFLPRQRILFQADFTLPQPGQNANPFVVSLAQRVDELGLDFERYLAVHAAAQPQTKAQLMAAIGK